GSAISVDAVGGNVDASASGAIFIAETSGTMQVGSIAATSGEVQLTASAITDGAADTAVDVSGTAVTLNATAGSIGAATDYIEIAMTTGVLTASATGNAYIDKPS